MQISITEPLIRRADVCRMADEYLQENLLWHDALKKIAHKLYYCGRFKLYFVNVVRMGGGHRNGVQNHQGPDLKAFDVYRSIDKKWLISGG